MRRAPSNLYACDKLTRELARQRNHDTANGTTCAVLDRQLDSVLRLRDWLAVRARGERAEAAE